MSYCIKCSHPLDINDKFCSECGTPIKTQSPNHFHFDFPVKPSINFANGASIGAGITLVIIGPLIALSLNAVYYEQVAYLAARGIEVSRYSLGLDTIVTLISLGALIAMLGVQLLVMGALAQFSSKVRSSFEQKAGRANVGNRLISAGFLLTSLSVANLARDHYSTYNSGWYLNVTVLITLVGLLVISVGALAMRSWYLKNLKSQKFKEQNPIHLQSSSEQ